MKFYLHVFDPFYQFPKIILHSFFRVKLDKSEHAFVLQNIQKHRKVLWINFFSFILVYFALRDTPIEQLDTLVTALLAPVMVMGAAWFAISFGGVPQKLIGVAIDITFWMFLAFSVSLGSMFLAVCFISSPIVWPVFVLIFLAAMISSIMYDTADGLKIGLDDAVLKHSRAAIMYYKEREGITFDDIHE